MAERVTMKDKITEAGKSFWEKVRYSKTARKLGGTALAGALIGTGVILASQSGESVQPAGANSEVNDDGCKTDGPGEPSPTTNPIDGPSSTVAITVPPNCEPTTSTTEQATTSTTEDTTTSTSSTSIPTSTTITSQPPSQPPITVYIQPPTVVTVPSEKPVAPATT